MHPVEGPESSVQSGSTLKEHDYIGLAEVSSALHHPSPAGVETARDLNLEETDLRLGLGPLRKAEDAMTDKPCSHADKAKPVVLSDSRQEQQQLQQQQQTRYNTYVDGGAIAAEEQRNGPNVWPSTVQHVKNMCMPAAETGAPAPMLVNGYGNGNRSVAVPKNAMKRGYETMSDARFSVTGMDARSMVNNAGVGAAMHAAGEQDSKALPKHQPGSFLPTWTPPKPSIPGQWYAGLEQPATSFPSIKTPAASPLQKPAAGYKPRDPVETPSDSTDVPPSKSRVVGWPPVATYRKQQTLVKPAEMFVKVNMDGITVGRKVDLNAHTTYDSLLIALEEMFQPSNNAQVTGRDNVVNDVKQFRLRNGSEFVLTYEDKEGDWMLVGDVPWSLFVTTVKRLRIVRGTEATGLAPGGLDNVQCPV